LPALNHLYKHIKQHTESEIILTNRNGEGEKERKRGNLEKGGKQRQGETERLRERD